MASILDTLRNLSLDGVPQKDLDEANSKVSELMKILTDAKIERWAIRASLLKALYDDADEYFAQKLGTFRELAAFDNGVATALRNLKQESP
ncbi:MAG: hypothetical protein OK457_07305 [Thaumarchaeota archaeon]|nr:hypothetical protein [Nitrososphaerota archaeon]